MPPPAHNPNESIDPVSNGPPRELENVSDLEPVDAESSFDPVLDHLPDQPDEVPDFEPFHSPPHPAHPELAQQSVNFHRDSQIRWLAQGSDSHLLSEVLQRRHGTTLHVQAPSTQTFSHAVSSNPQHDHPQAPRCVQSFRIPIEPPSHVESSAGGPSTN